MTKTNKSKISKLIKTSMLATIILTSSAAVVSTIIPTQNVMAMGMYDSMLNLASSTLYNIKPNLRYNKGLMHRKVIGGKITILEKRQSKVLMRLDSKYTNLLFLRNIVTLANKYCN
jgi:hypothetical protein